jgi:tRNA nucleotidyltransferase/poly(A) polymerase
MRLSELLQTLDKTAEDYDLSTPYIVGGLPRDKAFDAVSTIKDIDITTGDKDCFALAMSASRVWPDAHFRSYDDGHSSIDFKNIRLDFSNNFNLPNINDVLKDMGIKTPSELEKEMYSRDFTINTLLQPMNLEREPLDITGKALEDIRNKILRTPVDPKYTIGYDPRRILRAVKMIMKFDLTPEPDLEEALVRFRGGLSELPINHIKKQVNQMLDMDSKRALDLLIKYKLLPIIPLSRMMTLELAKNRMVQHLLEGQEMFS